MKPLLLTITALLLINLASAQSKKATVRISADTHVSQISPHIYGHFAEHLGSCIYGGIWVGKDSPIPNTNGYRNDVISAIKRLEIPNLRWPGGCFADEYHWRDGIGPRENRPRMVNTNWGGVVEDNSFGTHEFLDFCELIGTEPYICGNVGSGTVEEMAKWVEYITFDGESPMADLRRQNGREKPWKVKYWGVGNENWGCGGNMQPEYYADLYRRYGAFCKNFSGNKLYKIAGGPNADDYNWSEVLMNNIGLGDMEGMSLHYYTVPTSVWKKKGSATNFTIEEYLATMKNTLKMEEIITKNIEIMDKVDPQKKVSLIVDEWGIWADVEPGTNPGFLYQQNSMRDAIIAAVNFNIFNKHSDRVHMTNIAQMVNVLQAIVLTDNDKMLLTPTFYAFEMYKGHKDGVLVKTETSSEKIDGTNIEMLSESVSIKDGVMTITLANIDPVNGLNAECVIDGATYKNVKAEILTSGNVTDHNTFDNANKVAPKEFKDFKLSSGVLNVKLPSKSIVKLTLN